MPRSESNGSSKHHTSYREGDWFAVPLRDGGYAVGVIARANVEQGVVLGYFFGPRRLTSPALSDLQLLSAEDAVMVCRFGDLRLVRGDWPILGRFDIWNRRAWRMTKFQRRDVLNNQMSFVEYDDDDPSREIGIAHAHWATPAEFPADSLFGAGAVEIQLTKLLAESAKD